MNRQLCTRCYSLEAKTIQEFVRNFLVYWTVNIVSRFLRRAMIELFCILLPCQRSFFVCWKVIRILKPKLDILWEEKKTRCCGNTFWKFVNYRNIVSCCGIFLLRQHCNLMLQIGAKFFSVCDRNNCGACQSACGDTAEQAGFWSSSFYQKYSVYHKSTLFPRQWLSFTLFRLV